MIHPGPGQKRITWDDDQSTLDIDIPSDFNGQRLNDGTYANHGFDGTKFKRPMGGSPRAYAFANVPDDGQLHVTFTDDAGVSRTGTVLPIS